MRRPVPIATLSALFLIVLGLPFLGIRFNTVDPTVLPKEASARQAYDEVSAEFPPYRETPIWIAVDGAGPRAAMGLAGRIRRVEGVAAVTPPQRLREGVVAIRAISDSPFKSESSQSTVERIRELPAPPGSTVQVGGATADFIDFQGSLARHLPISFAIIFVATLAILFMMTGRWCCR